MRVPRLHRYYGRLRLPNVPPAALRCLRLAVPAGTPVFAPCCPTSAARPGALQLATPRQISAGDAGISQVPGEPSCTFALALDPGRTIPPSHSEFRCCPRSFHDEGSRKSHISRLDPTALALAVYASPRRLPKQDARLASGCWLDFAGRDWLPSEFERSVSEDATYIFIPLPQAWPGARNVMPRNPYLCFTWTAWCGTGACLTTTGCGTTECVYPTFA